MHGAKHFRQHGIGFNLEVIGLKFNGHMAIAQVIGCACEIKGRTMCRAGRDAHQSLRRCFHLDQTAIVCHQHITAAHHMTALQKH